MEQQRENPCCVELKRRCLKLDQKRIALRQAVQMLTHQLEQVQSENLQLKQQAAAVQNGRPETDKGGREEESAARKGLVKEINNLKSKLSSLQIEKEKESTTKKRLEEEFNKLKTEISSLKEERCKTQARNDAQQLEARVLDAEADMERLRKLLDEERRRAESERRNAEMEKKKSSDAWTLVKTERQKADEQRRLGEIEKKKVDEFELLVEKTRTEMANVEEKLKAVRNQAEDASKRAEVERKKAKREKKSADLERAKVEALTKAAEAEKKNAESERAKMEVLREAAEVEKKKTMEGKLLADHLLQQLKVEAQKRAELEKELTKRVHAEKERSGNHIYDDCEVKVAKAKLLKEALKLEKKRAKCARESARIQEAEKGMLWRELDSMKQSFSHVVQRLNMLDHFFLYTADGVGLSRKLGSSPNQEGFTGRGEFSNVLPQYHSLQYRNEFIPAQLKNVCSCNCSGAARECIGPLPSDLAVNCGCHPGSGIKSDLESPTGDSLGQMKQIPVTCSTTASFSDGQLMGSQERGQSLAASATGLRCRSASSISGEACKFTKSKGSGALLTKDGGTQRDAAALSVKPAVYDAIDPEDYPHVRKKRRIQNMLDSITQLCSEDKKLRLEIKESLSALSDLILEKRLAQNGDPLNAKNSKGLHSSGILNESRTVGNLRGDKSEKRKSYSKFIDQENQIRESVATGVMLSDSLGECRLDDHVILEEDNSCPHNPNDSLEEEDVNVISPTFEDMVNGNIMKIFDLDNASDEERYRAAVATPLSPLLPVLDPPGTEQSGKVASEDAHRKMIECEEPSTVPLDSLDVIALEVCLNKQKSRSSNSPGRVIPRENVDFLKETRRHCMDSLYKELNEKHLDRKHSSTPGTNSTSEKLGISMSCTVGKSSVDLEVGRSQHPVEKGSKMGYCGSINLRETQMHLPSLGIDPRVNKPSVWTSVHVVNESTQPEMNHPGSVLGAKELTKTSGFAIESSSGTCLIGEQTSNSPILLENLTLDADIPVSCDGAWELLPASVKFNQSSPVMEFESSDIIATAKPVAPSNASGGSEHQLPYRFSIVNFLTKDKNGMCKIASTVYALACQMPTVERNDLWKFLYAGLDVDLQTEEKICIFLSILIDHYSGLVPPISESSWNGNMFPESFKTEIQTVVCEAVRQPFLDTCGRENLLCLIQDFLICRKILNCVPAQKSSLDSSYSTGNLYHLRGADVEISPQDASHNQLVAASLILASSCSVLGDVDFLQEVSCNILLSCRDDFTWALAVLHVFASFCGVDFLLNHEDYIPSIVIRSVVLLLESRRAAVSGRVDLVTENSSNSFSCKNCPFAQNSVSVDEVIQVLLRRVEKFVRSGFSHSHHKTVAVNLIRYIPDLYSISETHRDNKVPACIQENYEFGASLENNDVLAQCSDLFVDENLGFMDTASFLELVGCHLDWNQISDKILPDLLKISESCSNEEYSVVLLVLIGKLSRLGIGAGGYAQKILADVRAFLLRHLDSSACENPNCLRVQFAAFHAVLDLLPTNLREKMTEGGETSNLGDSFHELNSIRDWFSRLSVVHKESMGRVLRCGNLISNS